MLFQIVDDILDVTASQEETGKSQGSDERLGKRTYVSVFGLEAARGLAGDSYDKARAALATAGEHLGGDAGALEQVTDFVYARESLWRESSRSPTGCSIASAVLATCTISTTTQLQQLAQEVREYIIDTVGEVGGHFGANLGTCELAVALHSLLDSPQDKISGTWDTRPTPTRC